jgi:regulator of sigma E protease
MTGDAARVGLASLISFVAFLSLQLGILNLLPIPVLDGGHVMFLSLEALLHRPINVKIREAAQQVGFIVLLVFILIISYNDIRRVLPIPLEELFK